MFARSRSIIPENLKPEKDSAGRLHYHGTVKFPKEWSYAKFNSQAAMLGMHVYTKPIYYSAGWKDYTEKEQPPLVEDTFVADPEWKASEVLEVASLLQPIPRSILEF